MICGSGGSKSRLAKPAGAEPCRQMRNEKLDAMVARSTKTSQNAQKTPQSRTTFGSYDVQQCGAVVARSAFASQNVKNMSVLGHLRRDRCQKNVHTYIET